MRANGRISRAGQFGLRDTMRDVAEQWRRLAADADAEARGENPLT